jgi:hypothetical protein
MWGLLQTRRVTIGTAGVPPAALTGARADSGARAVRPYETVNGKLSIDLDEARRPLVAGDGAAAGGSLAVRRGRAVELAVPLAMALETGAGEQPVQLVLSESGGRRVEVAAQLVAAGDATRLEARVPFSRLPRAAAVRPGTWALSATLRPGSAPAPLGAKLVVGRSGRVAMRAHGRAPKPPPAPETTR